MNAWMLSMHKRKISHSRHFARDYKRESKGRHGAGLQESLKPILDKLVNDIPLDSKYRDHTLIGAWKGYRDCHVKPDLVLVYQLQDDDCLYLVRLGSHAELKLG